jgi:membrane protein involved in colicin uptake
MYSLVNLLKRTIGIGVFGAGLLFAASMTANAQSGNYDPYYDQQNDGYYNQNQRTDKRHRKQEKRELKHHQRHEREYYGNSRQLRRHQEQERRQVKRHQRNERNDGYYNNRRRNNDDDHDH